MKSRIWRGLLVGSTLALCSVLGAGLLGCGDDDNDTADGFDGGRTDVGPPAGGADAPGGTGAVGGTGGMDAGGDGGAGGTGGDGGAGGSGGDGGDGGTGGAGGTDDMDASQQDGSSGTGGGTAGAAGSAGSAGSSGSDGGPQGLICGDDTEVCTTPSDSILAPCCTDEGLCGGGNPDDCNEWDAPGVLDTDCPSHFWLLWELRGCCKPEGTCGVMSTLGLGCIDRTKVAAYAGGPLNAIDCGDDMDGGT